MEFSYSDRCKDYLNRVRDFMDAYVYEGEETYHPPARRNSERETGAGKSRPSLMN